MALIKVRMTRVSKDRWDLLSPQGHVIVGDLLLYSKAEAKAWVENYISSFLGWTYEIVDLWN